MDCRARTAAKMDAEDGTLLLDATTDAEIEIGFCRPVHVGFSMGSSMRSWTKIGCIGIHINR